MAYCCWNRYNSYLTGFLPCNHNHHTAFYSTHNPGAHTVAPDPGSILTLENLCNSRVVQAWIIKLARRWCCPSWGVPYPLCAKHNGHTQTCYMGRSIQNVTQIAKNSMTCSIDCIELFVLQPKKWNGKRLGKLGKSIVFRVWIGASRTKRIHTAIKKEGVGPCGLWGESRSMKISPRSIFRSKTIFSDITMQNPSRATSCHHFAAKSTVNSYHIMAWR